MPHYHYNSGGGQLERLRLQGGTREHTCSNSLYVWESSLEVSGDLAVDVLLYRFLGIKRALNIPQIWLCTYQVDEAALHLARPREGHDVGLMLLRLFLHRRLQLFNSFSSDFWKLARTILHVLYRSWLWNSLRAVCRSGVQLVLGFFFCRVLESRSGPLVVLA